MRIRAGAEHPTLLSVTAYGRELFLDRGVKQGGQRAELRPIPPLSPPGADAAIGGCGLCGEPLTDGHTLRCPLCVKVVNLMLARLSEEATDDLSGP